MKSSQLRILAPVWCVSSALLVAFLLAGSQWLLNEEIAERVEPYLLVTLDESHFSNLQGRVNDDQALRNLGVLINASLDDLVATRWYSARKDCVIRLQSVDAVAVDEFSGARQLRFSLPRNGIERELIIGVTCQRNGWVAVGIAGVLAGLFLLLCYLLPLPLSRAHRDWLAYLEELGYPPAEAHSAIEALDTRALSLGSPQKRCLEQLHDPAARNFPNALAIASDERIAKLQGDEFDWLLLGLRRDPEDLDSALALAGGEDVMAIDLERKTLHIRGLEIPTSSTPLFYLTWYAMQRGQEEGWVTNPASNRPDREVGSEIAELMSRFGGHARAINDLEQAGLKARTLDQNRSKIKDDIVAILGEELAAPYLFEAGRHPDGVRMRYRLALGPGQVRVIS